MSLSNNAAHGDITSCQISLNTDSKVAKLNATAQGSPQDLPSPPTHSKHASSSNANATQSSHLSAIVVNHNGGQLLRTCVEALALDPSVTEIVVVDNASNDGSLDLLRKVGLPIKVIRSSENLGFGGGANLGAAHASSDLLVFLNPDTQPNSECMSLLVRQLVTHGGVAGPAVRHGTHGPLEYGSTVDRMLLPRGLEHQGRPLYVQGCCLATTRTCFQTVGGFDARYFLFCEDLEYCWQALRRGFPVDLAPGASIVHIGGTAAPGGYRRGAYIETSIMRILLRERNSWTVALACVPLRHLPLVLAASLLRMIAFSVVLARSRRLRDCARLWASPIWTARHLRNTVQRRRSPRATVQTSSQAWNRVEHASFLWEFLRRGDRLVLLTSEPTVGSHKDQRMQPHTRLPADT